MMIAIHLLTISLVDKNQDRDNKDNNVHGEDKDDNNNRDDDDHEGPPYY